MTKIKLMNKIASVGVDILKNAGYEVGEDVANAEGIMVRSASLHEMEFDKELLGIARAGAGVNNIPVDACAEKGIVVFNTPGANANAVKELTIAALLLSSRKITAGIEWAKTLKGEADAAKLVEKGKAKFEGPEILGKKLGVIGLGAIGVMVANAAKDLGMDVYGYDPYISVNAAWGLSRGVHKADSLKEIYENSDYITIHVPYMPATKDYINADALAQMKEGVRIINCSRGEVVNNAAIGAALESGKVACYVTDFANVESLELPNTICMPHLGATTPESETNCAIMAAKELDNYIKNGIIKNSVNFPDFEDARDCDIRVCVFHKNIPNMLTTLSGAFAKSNINIEHMTSKSKKDFAYTVLDINGDAPADIIASLSDVDGVIRVRVIK